MGKKQRGKKWKEEEEGHSLFQLSHNSTTIMEVELVKLSQCDGISGTHNTTLSYRHQNQSSFDSGDYKSHTKIMGFLFIKN